MNAGHSHEWPIHPTNGPSTPRRNRMPRCQHNGCPNPADPHSRHKIGLCTYHDHKVTTGYPPPPTTGSRREHPIEQAQHLLQQIARPGESLRSMSARTGIPKDTISNIIRGKYRVLRSEPWELLQDAVAGHIYEQNLKAETCAAGK